LEGYNRRMYLASVCQWMWRRALLSPAGWLWMALSLGALPLLQVLTPEGLFGHGGDPTSLTYQVAFLSGMGGAMLAIGALQENAWILRRGGQPKELASMLAALAGCSLAGAVLVAAGSALGPTGFPTPGSLWLAILLSSLHLGLLGVWILRLPGAARRSLLLPLVAWILPGLVTGASPAADQLASLLRAHHAPAFLQQAGPAGLLGAFGPIMVLAAGALLLGAGPSQVPARSH